jgi:hypothetical protein
MPNGGSGAALLLSFSTTSLGLLLLLLPVAVQDLFVVNEWVATNQPSGEQLWTIAGDDPTFIAKPPHAGSILLRRLLHRNVATIVRELPEPIRALVMFDQWAQFFVARYEFPGIFISF